MLAASRLSVELRDRALLADVSVAVYPGETVAVVGENGAGKTTLLRLLSGDTPPPGTCVTGRVHLSGRNILDWPLAERARLRAVLPQRPELGFAFTSREVVAMGRCAVSRRWRGSEDRAIADAALALTDALHLADREVTTLSGGEQARVHLAAALAQLWEAQYDRPRFLLLDEPTAALDLAHQHALLEVARGFARTRGIGLLAILHDLNLAATYADRIILLQGGRILAQGMPCSVLRPGTIAKGFGVSAEVIGHPLTPGILVATAAR